MADLVDDIFANPTDDAGVAPTVGPLALPQLPFAADPGTITAWIVAEMGDQATSEAKLIDAMQVVTTLYDAAPTDASRDEYWSSMATACPNALGFNAFLAEVMFPGDATTHIALLYGMAVYSPGFGVASPFAGTLFAFFGDYAEGRCPIPLRRVIAARETAATSLTTLFAPKPMMVPTTAMLDAHYVAGGGRIPMLAVAQGEDIPTRALPYLQHVPGAWAPYLMGSHSPIQALDIVTALVACHLPSDAGQRAATTLVEWCRAACVHRANRKAQCYSNWDTPVLMMDREASRWVDIRLRQFRSAPQDPVPVPGTGTSDGTGTTPPTFVFQPAESATAKAAKAFTPEEDRILRSAMSLSISDYPAMRPKIWDTLLSEGKKSVTFNTVLARHLSNFLVPGEKPISVMMTSELAKDIQGFKFDIGGGAYDYETCHRGITPFAVIAVSHDVMNKRRRLDDAAALATFRSAGDILALEAGPGMCPSTYDSTEKLLLRYVRLLEFLFGPGCRHLIEVKHLLLALQSAEQRYDNLSGVDSAELLWNVFVDARKFFSASDPDTLPVSAISATDAILNHAAIPPGYQTPLALLLGLPAPGAATPHGGGRQRNNRAGPALAGNYADLGKQLPPLPQFVPPPAYPPPAVVAAAGPKRTNPFYAPPIAAIFRTITAVHPSATIAEVCSALRVQFRTLAVGAPRSCLNFNIMGYCATPHCNYHHEDKALPATDVARIVPIFKSLAADFLARQQRK